MRRRRAGMPTLPISLIELYGKCSGFSNAAFRLACRSPHCHFDGDFCTTAQTPFAAEGRPSGKQRLANKKITLSLCPPRQTADSWILFNSGAMPLSDKAKAAWLLRAATLKHQAMIMRRSSKAASGKLVWNQHKTDSCKLGTKLRPCCRGKPVHQFQRRLQRENTKGKLTIQTLR